MFGVKSHHPKLDWFKKMVGCKNSQINFFQKNEQIWNRDENGDEN